MYLRVVFFIQYDVVESLQPHAHTVTDGKQTVTSPPPAGIVF